MGNTDPTDSGFIDCVAGGDDGNAACSLAVDGFYPSTPGDCPTGTGGSMSIEQDDGTKSTFDSTGKCYGTCDNTDTLIEQNEAVLGELQIQLLTLFLTAIIVQNTLEVGIPFLVSAIKGNKKKKDAEAGDE